ncbi:MAG: preprotein translocase subunit SecG [Betaproteobacteria bacterium]|nr:preprotein translocase subunit SecG [Betaproteobacteria bacterium]
MLTNILLIIDVLAAIAIVVLVLLQHGKGADMGAVFGSGSAGSLFGASGATNFLSRSTAICATIFFTTSLALTYLQAPKAASGITGGVTKDVPAKVETNPATPPASSPATAPAAAPADAGAKSQQIPK